MFDKRLFKIIIPIVSLLVAATGTAIAQERKGPVAQQSTASVRFGLPADVIQEYRFLGEKFPIGRPDIKARIISQINFLLYDARSVMTEWVLEKSRFNWIYREAFSKAGVPEDFIWLAPVLAGATKSSRPQGVGVWMLEKPCSTVEGVEMREDSFMDDRLDIQLSTRCFAQRISAIHRDYSLNWPMATVAYLSSPKAVK